MTGNLFVNNNFTSAKLDLNIGVSPFLKYFALLNATVAFNDHSSDPSQRFVTVSMPLAALRDGDGALPPRIYLRADAAPYFPDWGWIVTIICASFEKA
jgi:hypothetical protein